MTSTSKEIRKTNVNRAEPTSPEIQTMAPMWRISGDRKNSRENTLLIYAGRDLFEFGNFGKFFNY